MAEFPALPLWTDRLIGDTTHLSTEEFGAYMLMLIVAWRSPTCSLSPDDEQCARITRAGARWKKIKDIVLAFWQTDEHGRLYQKRLSEVREQVRVRHEKARQAALTKHQKNNNMPHADAEAAQSGRSAQAHPTKTISISSKKEAHASLASQRAKRRATMPADHQLSERDRAYAAAEGFDEETIDRQGARWRDYHLSKGTLIADLHASWRTWVANIRRFTPSNGNGNARKLTGAETNYAAAALVIHDLEQQANSGEDFDPPVALLDRR